MAGTPPLSPSQKQALQQLAADTAKVLQEVFVAVWELIALAINPLAPADADKAIADYKATITSGVGTVLKVLPRLAPLVADPLSGPLAGLVTTLLGQVDAAVSKIFGTALNLALEAYESGVDPTTVDTDSGVEANRQTFITHAFEMGVGAHVIATLPELMYISKQLGLNATAALLAELAGFSEVILASHRPFMQAVLGRPSIHTYNRKYPTNLPRGPQGAAMQARGIVTPDRASYLLASDGYDPEWQTALTTAAMTGIRPMMLTRVLDTGILSSAAIQDEMTFTGMRPLSQTRILQVGAYLSSNTARQKYESALEKQYIEGLLSLADFQNAWLAAEQNLDRGNLIQLYVTTERLTTEVLKMESEYTTMYIGQVIDDPTYRSYLEGLGLDSDKVTVIAGYGEARLAAMLQRKAVAAAAALTRATTAEERRAAMKSFATGQINAVELAAALVATGLSLTQVAAWVAFAQAAQWTIKYGVGMTKVQAQTLGAQVSAIKEQVYKTLITPAQGQQALINLGLPTQIATDEIAYAAAEAGIVWPVP